ncbi:CRISPR-associated RAMP protein [Aphanothece hegewaldii CCALA 016]|uniref:CRISPR-associated RAMP protein n=1 Tax=Aphanothece hegewaldii CCALA 016 TaxID=2107694 RepID=A0A2T1LYB7_9CHRO|nr:CRISPR-associated RAMP protein Csx7 [Aphanothece hegewaldii]PSF37385.1 CRISPR-associated RAMP protein [Aphanothece hegewaldii CCALA 016]
MFDTFKNRLEITGTLITVTALRISAGRSSEPIGTDLPVIKDALGRPLIPGSSFKGALRSRLENFLRAIDSSYAEDPANFTTRDKNRVIEDIKQSYQNNDLGLTTALIGVTDRVSRLFGSPWIASKFQVRDLTVLPDYWFGQYQERDGVAIDRDTETAADGKLYDFQVVPSGTPFEFRAVVENAEAWELGLLMIGLYQFETEQIPLGGGRSRGLGVVRLEIENMNWIDVDNDPEKLISYLQKLVAQDSDLYVDGKQLRTNWTEALVNHLRQNLTQSLTVTDSSGG